MKIGCAWKTSTFRYYSHNRRMGKPVLPAKQTFTTATLMMGALRAIPVELASDL